MHASLNHARPLCERQEQLCYTINDTDIIFRCGNMLVPVAIKLVSSLSILLRVDLSENVAAMFETLSLGCAEVSPAAACCVPKSIPVRCAFDLQKVLIAYSNNCLLCQFVSDLVH